MIIAAYAGTGKTTYAKMHPQNTVDFVSMPYKYYLPELDCNSGEFEACKANFNNIMREDWPFNYVAAIKEVMSSDKNLLIPSDSRVLALLRAENIPYCLCYPQRDAKEIYRRRYVDRGNTEDFLNVFITGWDWFMDMLESDTYGRHIVIQANQFLSDVL